RSLVSVSLLPTPPSSTLFPYTTLFRSEAKGELESSLTSLQDTVTEFNNIEAPSFAEGIHQNLIEKNQELLDITNNVLENGEVVIEKLQDSEIYQTIDNIRDLKDQVEQLGEI